VLRDYRTAPLSEPERALLAFVEKLTTAAPDIRQEDVEALKRAGWSEEAVYDAITVSSLFNFYNRWCDGAGVQVMSDEAHLIAARQTASRGYTHDL
jgi:alkylhydroperoxidase family enzyme